MTETGFSEVGIRQKCVTTMLLWGGDEIPSGQEASLVSEPVWTNLWREKTNPNAIARLNVGVKLF